MSASKEALSTLTPKIRQGTRAQPLTGYSFLVARTEPPSLEEEIQPLEI